MVNTIRIALVTLTRMYRMRSNATCSSKRAMLPKNKMAIQMLLGVLIIYLTLDVTFGKCHAGKSICDWSNWEEWDSCSRTCGGGIRRRTRGMCCKASLEWDACLSDCGKNQNGSEDQSNCGDVCFHKGSIVSDSSLWYGRRCRCSYLFTGTCCEKKTCSWDNYYCWPGRCYSSEAQYCKCAPGFQRVTGPHETTCQLSPSNVPSIEKCETRVRSKEGDMKLALSTSSFTACKYLADFYGNIQSKYLIYDMLAEFHVSVSNVSYPKPDYIEEYNFGVTDTSLSVYIHPVTGSDLLVSTHGMFIGKVNSSDATQTFADKNDLTLSDDAQKLTDGQWLCVTYKITGGGFLRSVDLTQDHRAPSTPVPYRKTQTKRRICYRYDSSRPEHCKETHTCDDEPLEIDEIISRSEIIHAYFKGWNDPIPYKGNSSHASGIESYQVTIHEVLASNGNLASKVDPGIVQTKKVNSTTSHISLNLTSNKPKLYAIYLEVKDVADNTRHARRFVLFDKSSKIDVRENNVFYVQSASSATNYTWQTQYNDVCLNWTGYYYNRFYLDNPLLNQIEPDPHGLFTGVYEQRTGLLPVSGTPSIHGIVNYMVSWSKKNEVVSTEIDVPNFPQQYYCHTLSLNDGDSYTLNIKAIDIANHSFTDNRTVHIDRSVPIINNIGLVKDGIKRLFVHDTTDLSKMQLYFEALDPHSGIIGIEWAFGTSDSATDLATGHIDGTTMNKIRCSTNSSADHKCYCPDVGSCEMYDYSISLNKLVAIDKHIGDYNRSYYFTIKATNHAMLSNIEHIDILVDDSPPETGVIVEGPEDIPDNTSDISFIVHWHGFIDHESGILFYRVVLADHCLGQEDMGDIRKLNSYLVVEIPYTESSVRLTVNFTGKRYISIVAINNAMDTSEPVCSSEDTFDAVTKGNRFSLIGAIVGGVGFLCLAAGLIVIVLRVALRRGRKEKRVVQHTNKGDGENNCESMDMPEIPVHGVVQTPSDKEIPDGSCLKVL